MKKRQNSFLRDARRRCRWLATRPELFPSLYDRAKLNGRWPRRSKREDYAKIMELHVEHLVLEDQRRVGTPLADDSVRGVSQAQIAIRRDMGNPRVRDKWTNWRGKRRIAMRIRELREAMLLEMPVAWIKAAKEGTKRRPTNERFLITKGRWAGTWRLYPAVRRIGMRFFECIKLDRTLVKVIEELKKKRDAGEVTPIVDVQLRRARDREIKARQRARRRAEQLVLEAPRAVAAKRVTMRRRE